MDFPSLSRLFNICLLHAVVFLSFSLRKSDWFGNFSFCRPIVNRRVVLLEWCALSEERCSSESREIVASDLWHTVALLSNAAMELAPIEPSLLECS